MRNKYLIPLLIIGLVLISSCKKKEDDNQSKSPGYFILTQTNKKSISDNSQNKNVNDFDLGNIKKSKEFNFSLANGGESPIFDITLGFNNSNFTIYPTNISELNASGNVSLNQLLKSWSHSWTQFRWHR